VNPVERISNSREAIERCMLINSNVLSQHCETFIRFIWHLWRINASSLAIRQTSVNVWLLLIDTLFVEGHMTIQRNNLWHRLVAAFQSVMDFQQRIWVVHVRESRFQDESFIVSEDSFTTPLQWMSKKGYSEEMLSKVELMKRSQVLEFTVGDCQHRLMRVK